MLMMVTDGMRISLPIFNGTILSDGWGYVAPGAPLWQDLGGKAKIEKQWATACIE
jgi:hypothetical protein